ncbi:MAG: tRNA pseudouridine(55) synthase TruB [Pirellulaceae bacterium]
MFGILNVHKPIGITSREVVGRVYRHVRPDKTGHAGTLDPIASGVLLIPIGAASRLVPYLHQLTKSYRATFLLGRRSPSDDSETTIEMLSDPPRPTRDQLADAVTAMVGQVMQRPPAYSAIKVAGRRAYDLARKGNEVALSARPVRIDRITIEHYEYPELVVSVECGSGTYIRSIGRDLAQACQSEAIMTALVRTAIGPFSIENALAVDALSLDSINAAILPAAVGVRHMPTFILNASEVQEIVHGRNIARRPVDFHGALVADDNAIEEFAALNTEGGLVAILVFKGNRLAPKRVFPVA